MEYPNPKPSVIEGLKTRYLLVNEKTLEEKYKGLRSKLLADYVPVYTCKHHTVYRLRRDSAEASGEAAMHPSQSNPHSASDGTMTAG